MPALAKPSTRLSTAVLLSLVHRMGRRFIPSSQGLTTVHLQLNVSGFLGMGGAVWG